MMGYSRKAQKSKDIAGYHQSFI